MRTKKKERRALATSCSNHSTIFWFLNFPKTLFLLVAGETAARWLSRAPQKTGKDERRDAEDSGEGGADAQEARILHNRRILLLFSTVRQGER
jgi:hypothetical protein